MLDGWRKFHRRMLRRRPLRRLARAHKAATDAGCNPFGGLTVRVGRLSRGRSRKAAAATERLASRVAEPTESLKTLKYLETLSEGTGGRFGPTIIKATSSSRN